MSSSHDRPRLLFLDWLRVLAFALLVPYHVGMYYVSWPWHVKSVLAGPGLEPWMRLTSPWRMGLLFLISGAATACMLNGRPATASWLRARAARLLLPLLAGVLLVVPPQSYFEVVQQHGYRGGFVAFMGLYLSGGGEFCRAGGACLILPTWNHLWFLPYVFVYTLLLWAWLRRSPAVLERAAAWCERHLSAVWLLGLPIVLLACNRVLLGQRLGETHALVDDWFVHLQSFALFWAGAVLARSQQLWPWLQARRWPALVLALGAWALWQAAAPAPGLLRALFVSTQQWAAIVTALGFAHRHLNRDHRLRQVLGEAVFPLYVLHQTVLIGLAVALAPLRLPALVEGPMLVLGTFGLAFASYLLLRRLPLLRPWFGLAPLAAPRPGVSSPPPPARPAPGAPRPTGS